MQKEGSVAQRTYLQLCDALMEEVSVPVILILQYVNNID